MIDHLKRLGVTAIELLPIHGLHRRPAPGRAQAGELLGLQHHRFFAPEQRYAQDNALDAFRTTVARLHDAGIEVMLDVVYNHTAEGNHLGPTLSFRGIDNASYYWLKPDDPRYYDDFTGCGNSLNLTHPRVLQMVMDSLRYWVEVCHVDGFRFDLATTLARGPNGFDRKAPFSPPSGRIRCWRPSSWSPSRGMSAPAAIRSARFPRNGRNGTTATADAMRRFWSGEGS